MRGYLEGHKVLLRPLTRPDLEYVSRWSHDPAVTEFMYLGTVPSYIEVLEREYDEMIAALPGNLTQGHSYPAHIIFVLCAEGAPIGIVGLFDINWMARIAELRAYIGEPDYRGGGRIHEAYQLILGYAFHRLNLRRVVAGVREGHVAAVVALKRVGFVQEGCFREHYERDGRFYDVLPVALLSKDYYAQVPCSGSG